MHSCRASKLRFARMRLCSLAVRQRKPPRPDVEGCLGRRRRLPSRTFRTSDLKPQSSHSHFEMASNEAVKDDDWEKAEGVPSMSEPFIQKYMAGRDALVQQEKKQRSGWWS
jgi:hypothetical protein